MLDEELKKKYDLIKNAPDCEVKTRMGRPEKNIDWKQVDTLLTSQCTADEIAGNLGINRTTLYYKIQEKYGVTFTTYSTDFYCKGKSYLRNKQFALALSGNIRMLDKLGDVYLDQASKSIIEKAPNQQDIDKDDIIARQAAELSELKKKLLDEDQRQASD